MKGKLPYIVIIILLLLALVWTSFGSLDNIRKSVVELLGGTVASEIADQPADAPPPEAAAPTEEPTSTPTEEPTSTPTEEPTSTPTEEPTSTPTEEPTPAPTEEPAAALVANTNLADTTNIQSCKLPSQPRTDGFDYRRLGIPRHPGFAPSTGPVEVVVLFADYSDARATISPEEEFALLNPDETSAFFSEASYGRMELEFNVHPIWLTLPQSASHYDEFLKNKTSDVEEVEFIEEVVTLADSAVDFSGADLIFVMTNSQANAGIEFFYAVSSAEDAQAIQADGTAIRTGMIFGRDLRYPEWEELHRNNLLVRRLGQAMTLMWHGFRDIDIFGDLTDQEETAATGSFSIMGNPTDATNAPGFFAFERWQLGWLDDEQIFCQTAGEHTTELTAIEQAEGIKSVMVPLGEQSALVVESRRSTGLDQDLVKEGALVYTVDTSVERGGAPIQVLPTLDNDWYRDQSPLAEGESVTVCNVTITNVAEGADGDTVQVTIPSNIDCLPGDTVAQAQAPAQASATGPGQLSFETFGSWKRGDQPYGTFTQNADPVKEGSFAGKLNYDFSAASAADDFVIFTQPIATSGKPNLVQAWVYGDGSGHLLNFWIEDANGEVWAVPMGTVAFTGWQQVTGAIDAKAPWPGGRVYGPDNGTIDYPIRFLGLVVDRTDGPKTGMLSFDDITFSTGEPPKTPTKTPAQTNTSTPDYCANIESPPADADLTIYIPNYTNETIWSARIDFPGVLNQEETYSAEPGEFIWHFADVSQLYAIMNSNKEIIRIFVAGTGPTQCEEVTSLTPDKTGKLVFITFTNGTNEGLYICRENEPRDSCGNLPPGEVSAPHPMYPTGKYNFIGENSGTTRTYVATDAPEQSATIQ